MADHGSMVTRSLGVSGPPPEFAVWSSEAPFSLLVCSSAFHRFRGPASYAGSLGQVAEEGGDHEAQGILIRIDPT
jgi:hypothetical protein